MSWCFNFNFLWTFDQEFVLITYLNYFKFVGHVVPHLFPNDQTSSFVAHLKKMIVEMKKRFLEVTVCHRTFLLLLF